MAVQKTLTLWIDFRLAKEFEICRQRNGAEVRRLDSFFCGSQTSLEAFLSLRGGEFPEDSRFISALNNGYFPLLAFSERPVQCPNCGSSKLINHGKRENLTVQVVRWLCKDCRNTFSWDLNVLERYNIPLELCARVVALFTRGEEYKEIEKELQAEALRRGVRMRNFSAETICGVARSICTDGEWFEKFLFRNLMGHVDVKMVWIIDFSPYILYRPNVGAQLKLSGERVRFKGAKGKARRRLSIRSVKAYLTGVITREERYVASVVTAPTFNTFASLKCLKQGLELLNKPIRIDCDGCSSHINAVKILLPDVELVSKRKSEDLNFIAQIENAWSQFKAECLKEFIHRFRSFDTLRLAVRLKRIHYNFLRPNMALDWRTPAEAMLEKALPGRKVLPDSLVWRDRGRGLEKSEAEKWEEFLRFVRRVRMVEGFP